MLFMEIPNTSTPEVNREQERLDLLALLDAHQIPYDTWTEQKTIEDLAAEIHAGESILLVDDSGKLRRHTAVAWVDVFSTNEQGERVHLKEARQEFNDRRPTRVRAGLPASLGEKILVGGEEPESPDKGAERAIKEELGIEKVDMIGFMGTAQREAEASSYPGLTTVYADHFFAVEVPFTPEGYKEVQAQKTTYFEWEPAPKLSEERFDEVLNRIRGLQPDLASDLILGHQDMSNPANVSFARNPRDPEHHSPSWHQHDIVTHSEKFRESLARDVPVLLEQWGIDEPVVAALNETVDGITKGKLLQIAAEVHDEGKFTARQATQVEDGSIKAHFTDHEAHSGKIVREGLRETFYDLGCTKAQVEYFARCAELHFELGKVRRAAIDTGEGFTLEFARSDTGKKAMADIIATYPDYALEIGLMFIADSFSKTEVYANIDSKTDSDIAAQREKLEEELRDKSLNPDLIKQALQTPVNIEVAKQYLTLWTQRKINYRQMG
jgi:hypothetical protein